MTRSVRQEPSGETRKMPDETVHTDDGPKMPALRGGVARPEDLPQSVGFDLAPLKRGPSLLSQGTLLILLVLAIAVGVIYMMRLSQGEIAPEPGSKEAEAKIDQALAKLTKRDVLPMNDPLRAGNLDVLFRDTEKVITMFSIDLTEHQVPIGFVQRNPFVFAMAKRQSAVDFMDASNLAERLKQKQREQQRRAELEREISKLVLQTVILGPVNVAVINSDMVKTGQVIGSFEIRKIQRMSVELVADGRMFTLSMSE